MDIICKEQAEKQSTENYSSNTSAEQSNEQGAPDLMVSIRRNTMLQPSPATASGAYQTTSAHVHQTSPSPVPANYIVCTDTPTSLTASTLVTEFNICGTATLSVQLPTSLSGETRESPAPTTSTDRSMQEQHQVDAITRPPGKRRRLTPVEPGVRASCRNLRSRAGKSSKTSSGGKVLRSGLQNSMAKPCAAGEGASSTTAYRHGPAPFSHEPEAQLITEQCDYSRRVTYEEAMSNTAHRVARVYADGVYDMFHSGHARQLMQAKNALPNVHLLVGVCNDKMVERYKGRVVMNEAERYEAVRHCRYVDEVLTNAPWSISDEFLREHKIDFVAHDEIPYASSNSQDVYKPLKDAGMFLVTQRTEGISTTDVIGRIVRDYDVYLRRNIKRGLSRQELNISYVKEKQLKLQDNLEHIVKRGTSFIQNFDTKRRELVDHLEDMSHEVVRSFMRIFGSDGRLRNWLHLGRSGDDEAGSPSSSPLSSTSSTSKLHSELPGGGASTDDESARDGVDDRQSGDDRQGTVQFFPDNAVPNSLRIGSFEPPVTSLLEVGDKCSETSSGHGSPETMGKPRRSSRVSSLKTLNGPDYPPTVRKELTIYRTAKEGRKMNREQYI